jgi:pimeloyl-ACP methyl ester carboxylesterase
MRAIGFLVLSLLPSLLAGCGNQSATSVLTDVGGNPRPLIIAAAGYSTCKTDKNFHNGMQGPLGGRLFRKVEDFAQTIQEKTGVVPMTLASCFTTDTKLIVSSSADPSTVKSPSDEEYIESLHAAMDQYSDIFIVGHSYGGWLAMKLVEDYHGPANKIKSLYSIDPISKKLCFFNNPEYCLSAPKDILAAGRQHINDMTQLWVNPWQNKTFYLHSSVIPQADENPKFNIEHYDLDTAEAIWSDMKVRTQE